MPAARLQDNTVALSAGRTVDVQHGLALPQRSAGRRGCLGCLPGVAAAPRAGVHRSQSDRGRHPDHHRRDRLASDHAGQQEGDELTYASPAEEVHFSCGSWILDQPTTVLPAGEPAKTLVITGFTCRTVTAFSGYQQLSTHTLPVSLSPVIAHTPDGARISGRIVAAQYGDVIVVAGSDRFDGNANELLGIGLTDSAELWRYPCKHGPPMGVRFANVPGGDNPAEGHITQGEVAPEVVASCEGQIVQHQPDDRASLIMEEAGQMSTATKAVQAAKFLGGMYRERARVLYWAHVRGDLFSRLNLPNGHTDPYHDLRGNARSRSDVADAAWQLQHHEPSAVQ